MIEAVDTLTGSPCHLCREPVGEDPSRGFALHEVAEDRWEVICVPCELVSGISEGK